MQKFQNMKPKIMFAEPLYFICFMEHDVLVKNSYFFYLQQYKYENYFLPND